MEKINSKSDRYSLMRRIFLSLAINSPSNKRFFPRVERKCIKGDLPCLLRGSKRWADERKIMILMQKTI